MKNKRILVNMTAIAALVTLAALGIVWQTQPVQATIATAAPLTPIDPTPTPTPCLDGLVCYSVAPSNTDGRIDPDDCDARPNQAIGCEDRWQNGSRNDANNNEHYFYLPPSLTETGKLLVFLCGGVGNAVVCKNVFPVAARQGYHVIGLTYPVAPANSCGNISNTQRALDCFGDAFDEVVTGNEKSPSDGGDRTSIGEHDQDSIVNRLLRGIQWADANHPDDGWNRYLINNTAVDWTKIHLAGMSNGSSHASFMGILYPSVGRVALFAGPNDGKGGSAEAWDSASYIQPIEGITDTRYYGLVHRLNSAPDESNDVLYEVAKNWHRFGMEDFRPRFEFIPSQTTTPADFDGAQMLISIDPDTTARDAHLSVVRGKYCLEYDGPDGPCQTDEDEQITIGYEPAWRCILGTGQASVSTAPVADAGVDQTLECQGSGGANVDLNGSGSRDPDCDVLSYTWTGPFGVATGRNPRVFLPVGTSVVTLEVSDGWPSSTSSDTTLITVVDTQPPSLHVTLTPTTLWPANHHLVRINATVSAADSCGGPPPQIVLTSITSNQPDNGSGDGNTNGDIEEASFGTFDTSFLLRAERAGGDPLGRTYTITYTATDASGNQTHRSATVHVPHSH